MYIVAYVEDNFLTEVIFKKIGFITINDWLFYSVFVVVLILSINGIASCCKKRKTKVIVHNGGIPLDADTGHQSEASLALGDEVVNINTDD